MSTWRDLVTASLIGTERARVPPTAVPGLPALGDPAAGDQATALLDRAALLTAARRAGKCPDHADPLPVAGPDRKPAVSQAACDRLGRILSGEHQDLLAEWLTAAVARGLRAPAQLLPALLDRARRTSAADSELRRLVMEAGGSRASWLAGINPEWKFVTAQALTGDDAWRHSDIGQRRGYLTALRASDRGAASELVAGSWAAASPAERVMFLSALAGGAPGAQGPKGLTPADEPLLEAALGDRAEEVRGWAAYLLAGLPGSALGQRMAERALRCLRLERGIRGTRLVAHPPAECDAAMRRDGMPPGPPAGRSQPADRTRLMLEVVARTPLRTWTDAFAMRPDEIVAVGSGDWAPLLFTGWSRAAMAQRDQEWMAALINEALTGRAPGTLVEKEALSKLARRADPANPANPANPALGAPQVLAGPEPGAPRAIKDAIEVLRFRYDMLKELDNDHGDS